MFDPLTIPGTVFTPDDASPPWPTTPHQPNSPIPNLRRAPSPASPAPPTPDKGPSTGPYGREPQIYGKPDPGLISPIQTVGSNGKNFEKPEPYLRVRITGLDRNRRDILIKLDAQTNLTNFTGTTYRNVSRSYLEFQQLYDAIIHNNPHTIIPALPLPQTSAPTDEEDDRLVKIMLQRWISRICEDQILLHDEDIRAFIESDFGYQPTPRTRKKSGSAFSLIRRGVPDEDEELQRARFELTKLETQFFDTAKAIDKLASARKTLAIAHSEMGNKLISVATTEAHPPLANALRKIGRTWHSLADLDQSQAISECVIIGDSFGYQGMNARSAKETLQQRTGVLEEYQAAVKTTISKRRHIERLKASSNIRPDRVDEALEEMEEANKYEQVLAKRAEGISQNLHRALQTHNRHANEDVTTALIEHTRSSITYERQHLRELEALCSDVANAANKVVPSTDGVPRPTVILPLEDYSAPPVHRTGSVPPDKPQAALRPPPIQPPPPGVTSRFSRREPLSASALPTPPRQAAAITQSSIKPGPSSSTLPSSSNSTLDPLSRSSTESFTRRTQSPGPVLSTPIYSQPTIPASPPSDEPPLGGRYIEGSRSVIVKSISSPISPPFTPSASSTFSPGPMRRAQLVAPGYSNTLGRAATSPNPLTPSPAQGTNGHHASIDAFDPLGQIKPTLMTSSVRVQPTRSRLDAREAASKLATMF